MASSKQPLLDFNAIIDRTNQHEGTEYVSLKDKQKEALSACSQADVICVLPTGYGKTVVIHMIPFIECGKSVHIFFCFIPNTVGLEKVTFNALI